MLHFLHTLGWLACVIYATIPSFWLMIHGRADSWRARKRSPYRVLMPLWFVLWGIFAIVTAPWRHIVLYPTPLLWIPAAFLFAIGISLYIASSKGFSASQLRGDPELHRDHPEQRLVTTGIRGHVRHPIYLAHLLEMLAWSVGTGLAVCYVLTAFAIITGAFMIRSEEHELEQRFGEPYLRYRSSVPALIPRF